MAKHEDEEELLEEGLEIIRVPKVQISTARELVAQVTKTESPSTLEAKIKTNTWLIYTM